MTKKTVHSSYWVDDTSVFDFDAEDINSEDIDTSSSVMRIVKLATVRRAVANFVRILTNDSSIQVNFSSGKNSYTDGKTVVISADDNSANFDSMVGLALHEGSHCLLSDFQFLQSMFSDDALFYCSIHPTLRKMIKLHPAEKINDYSIPFPERDKMREENDTTIHTLRDHLRTLMNIIEDRRIDSFVYKMAPGYRPYYDAMYKKYFFNTDIEKNMISNPDWRTPTVENYVNWLLLIFSPHFDQKALPGLEKMVKMIDLQNIRRFDEKRMPDRYSWKTNSKETVVWYETFSGVNTFKYNQFPLLWKVANELLIEILKRAKFYASQSPDAGNDLVDGMNLDDFDFDDIEDEGLPNLDLPPKKFNAEKAKKALKKMKEIMDMKGKKKKLKHAEQMQINSMESANAEMSENSDPFFGKVPCLVTKKLTKEIMRSDWFPFSNRWNFDSPTRALNPDVNNTYRGFLAGIRMGQILAHRLQVRNEPQVTHFTRQEHGKIDRRILSQLGMDIENVFKRTTVDQYNPALLYLSIDASGSMYGVKWERVITVATALAFAADKVRNLDVVISFRGNISSGIPTVAVAYDSRVDTFAKAKALFPYLTSAGSTPEGLCYYSTLELMEECAKTHTTYFINFSDGEPGCGFNYNKQYIDYSGITAYKQTKRMVGQMKELGIKVMSYFITERGYGYNNNTHTNQAFRDMYGQDAEFVDVKNVLQVLRTLNKLLLAKE